MSKDTNVQQRKKGLFNLFNYCSQATFILYNKINKTDSMAMSI